jgi:hypothetical protein
MGNQLSVRSTIQAMINQFSIDRVFSFDTLSPAVLFAVYYEGTPPGMQHGSNWSGFGIVFALFKWWGILVYLVGGLLIGAILARWVRPWFDLSGFVRVMFLTGVFSIFLTGSFATVIPEYITETILAIAIIAGLEVLQNTGSRPIVRESGLLRPSYGQPAGQAMRV